MARQMQAGRPPPGEVEKIAAWHIAFRLTVFGAEYGWGPTGQDLGNDHNRCDLPILILSLSFPANSLQPPLVLCRWLGPSSCQLWMSPPQSRASASSQVARSLGQSGDSPADLVPFHTHLIYPPRVGAPGSVLASSQGRQGLDVLRQVPGRVLGNSSRRFHCT